jgi:hypothetical protein
LKKMRLKKDAHSIREAQWIVGELIWLVTRRRPGLLHVTSQMSMLTTRKPLLVRTMAALETQTSKPNMEKLKHRDAWW